MRGGFDDYCNWQRIPEFERVIKQSEVAEVAAKLMGSERVQMFHDHVLVKGARHHQADALASGWAVLFR